MSQDETRAPTLTVRSSNVRHIVGLACAGLVYLGIIATLAFFAFIAWARPMASRAKTIYRGVRR
jgi:hypothetical protein